MLIDEQTKRRRYLAISDLHIGFESQMSTRGINIDEQTFFDEIRKELADLINFNKIDAVILLGDLKNSIQTINKYEWEVIPQLFEFLSEVTDIYLVPGNHDSNIRFLMPENVNIMGSKGMILDDTLFIHGHAMPTIAKASIKRIVMGHIHPIFLRHNSLINGQRVWIYLKLIKKAIFPATQGDLDIVIVPAFNRYIYATNARHYTKSISPIIAKAIKSNAVRQALLVSLDGSIVGDIESLLEII